MVIFVIVGVMLFVCIRVLRTAKKRAAQAGITQPDRTWQPGEAVWSVDPHSLTQERGEL